MPIDSREVYDHGLGEALFYGLVKCGTAWGMLFELKSAIRTSDTMRTQKEMIWKKHVFWYFFVLLYLYYIYYHRIIRR